MSTLNLQLPREGFHRNAEIHGCGGKCRGLGYNCHIRFLLKLDSCERSSMLGDICIICSGSGETLHWDDIKEQTTVERCFSCRGRGIENTPHHDNRITNDTQLGLEEAVKAVNRFIGGHK